MQARAAGVGRRHRRTASKKDRGDRVMGEPAIPFWDEEEEVVVEEAVADFEDVALLSTGVDDLAWKFGSD
jgi:hypothetical protein